MIGWPDRLSADDLARLQADMAQAGSGLSAAAAAALAKRWRPVVQPRVKHEEPFDLVDEAGQLTGVIAPRWLCHLLGLGHRTVHLALHTPQGWLVLQVRGRHVDWPELLDLSVTGHVRAGLDWEQAMRREAAEELGLDLTPGSGMITEAGCTMVGRPYHRAESDSVNPPVHICHVTQLFAATLSPAGLASLRFSDGEVEGLYLASFDEVNRLVQEAPDRLAPGLVQSWPHYAAASKG